MRAIVRAIQAGELAAETRLIVCNNADAPALDFARAEGLPWRHISGKTEGGADAADRAIADAFTSAGAELIVLSGYMRKLGPKVLAAYARRILNIHPALLPKHGGQGMYGRRVHEAVHAAGDTVSGATIHIVEGEYDSGPILAALEVILDPGDTAADIEHKVQTIEPALYVETLRRIASGDLALP
jgi:phosphoribosylglycinamide formyltransferase-1